MSLVPAPQSVALWRGRRGRDAGNIKALEEILLRSQRDGKLYCVKVHTPESCKEMYDSVHAFVDSKKEGIKPEIEEHIYEAFVEGDFDENDVIRSSSDPDAHAMFCISLHPTLPTGEADPRPLGVAFWRDLPEDDVKQWMKKNALKAISGLVTPTAAASPPLSSASGSDSTPSSAPSSFPLQHSPPLPDSSPPLTFEDPLTHALDALSQPPDSPLTRAERALVNVSAVPVARGGEASAEAAAAAAAAVLASLAQRWIRLELVAVLPSHQGKGLSSLLMVAVLLGGLLHSRDRCTLCVAGGAENTVARKLDAKFGFVDVPAELLNSPNRNVMMHASTREAFRATQVRKMVVLPGEAEEALVQRKRALEHKP